ncbi:MAG: hypothetical protein ING37_05935 [Rhodocyclaceae bacterium]|nr:hypothetical protein [Rhodocyclaceae bacterium]
MWSLLKRQFEGLSHLRQYVRELSWSADEYRGLLAKRVESYLDRRDEWGKAKRYFPLDHTKREIQLIGLIFADPMPWGGDKRGRHPHQILHTLSRHRPRWLIGLCKEAAKSAVVSWRKKIGLDDITSVLAVFGQQRIDDTIAEFQAQCPQVGELVSAFSRQNERYQTDDLIKTIKNRILGGVHPQIVGISGAPDAVEIAHFLFQIGFLTARRDLSGGHYQHLAYAEAPHLLSDRTNFDDGVSWEIHPVFRQVLRLQNVPT